ncbi:hypothetical protein ACLOJK_011543 [Asimina triloba]
MPRKSASSSSAARSSNTNGKPKSDEHREIPKRSAFVWLALCFILFNSAWAVYHYQYERLPTPLTAEQAGKRGFSEHIAMEHVEALTRLGPHPVGSDALDLAVQASGIRRIELAQKTIANYVLTTSENIKKIAHWEVDIQLDLFHAKTGANRLTGGLFKGKTLVYSDLKHVVMRISPKYLPEVEESAILVSSHIDTVFSSEGAGDCSSCVAVMLELARAISQWAHGFKKSVIFLFNTGEEDGLSGAHSFITQHPWSRAICLAVDLEAMGIGGKSGIFQLNLHPLEQSGPDPWAIESFARVAKYPSAQIIGQASGDLFLFGVIKSATDYQVYSELAGLSGLDFAFTDVVAVYHTKNDKLSLLKPGSLQHLGDNMLAFLLQTAASSYTPRRKEMKMREGNVYNQMVYFDVLHCVPICGKFDFVGTAKADAWRKIALIEQLKPFDTFSTSNVFKTTLLSKCRILRIAMKHYEKEKGTYMVFYSERLANLLHNSLMVQGLLIWATSLFVGGFPAVISLFLSFLSVVLMWMFSLSFALPVAFLVSKVSSSPVPYIANPWLVLGLFGAPAVLGALIGQQIGYLGNIYKVGSSYVALAWLVSPAFACLSCGLFIVYTTDSSPVDPSDGLIEATLTPMRSPKPLRIVTLILGLSVPVLISAGAFIRMMGTMIGLVVRLDRNPGATPEWLGNVVLATIMVAIVCVTFVYLLSYAHLSVPDYKGLNQVPSDGKCNYSQMQKISQRRNIVNYKLKNSYLDGSKKINTEGARKEKNTNIYIDIIRDMYEETITNVRTMNGDTSDFSIAIDNIKVKSMGKKMKENRQRWFGHVKRRLEMTPILICMVMPFNCCTGARRAVILATCAAFSLTLGMISAGVIHPFTDDVARAIHESEPLSNPTAIMCGLSKIPNDMMREIADKQKAVHVVDTTEGYSETQNPVSYISLFSYTPGKLTKEAESLKDEGFVCGEEKVLDLVTFSVKYGCYSSYDTEHGWSETEIPILEVESDLKEDARITRVSLDTKVSTRWTLAINTREIEDFKFEGNSEKLIPLGSKTGVDGWHTIQFAGGKNAPTKFEIILFWFRNSTHPAQKDEKQQNEDSHLLLKLRTDVNRITPKTARVLEKLPSWCSLFGKSTSPFTLAFLTSLPVEI